MRGELRVFPDPEALAAAAADLFSGLASQAIGARGRFAVALSGGSTPRAMLRLLAEEPRCSRIRWAALEIFWSDERAVPPDDPQSNYRMARETLLDKIAISPEQIHRMPAERASRDAAADEYAAEIRRTLAGRQSEVPRFDLVLLGMGEDGHTASLFPETEALEERERLVAANYVPKLASHRMTFTPKLINAAANVVFLIAGAGKAEVLHNVLEGPSQPRRYPSQLMTPDDGALFWYLDRAAAARLDR